MNIYKHYAISIKRIAAAVVASFTLVAATTSAQVRDLGIDAVLNGIPPNSSLAWFDTESGNSLRIDAFGKVDHGFGLGLSTSIAGRVTAQDLGDGTEKVSAVINTRNAICWGFNDSFALAFGYRPGEVVGGVGPAAIGNTSMRLIYVPQPIGQFDPLGELELIVATVSCQGELRAGSGYPEGTQGFAQSTQTGLLSTSVPQGCPKEGDANCFPAEKIQFKPSGP